MVKRRGDQIVRPGRGRASKMVLLDVNGVSIRSGKPNVGVQVLRSREASTVSVAKSVRKAMDEVNKELEKDHP